jgi:mucin-19
MLFLAVTLAVVECADAAVTITRTSSPTFYSDLGNGLAGGYVAYRISTDTAINDAWAQIGSFSGPRIGLGSYEPGLYHLGYLAPGSKMAYFYLKTSGVSTTAESHTVSVYDGKPPNGSALTSSVFSLTQQSTIQANSNKVSSVVTGPTNVAYVGSVITLTVTGDTGNTGGTLAFTAATEAGWPASSYRLYKSVINLPDNTVLNDQPYTAAYYGVSGTYVAVYSFVVQDTISTPAATNATGYILSGQQMKHTQTGGAAGNPAPPPVSTTSGNTVILSNTVSYPPLTPGVGGNATFTLHLTNTGSSDVTLDDIVNTLPSSPGAVSYVAGSTTYNGSAFPNPAISGSQLTWSGSFVIPAGGSSDLVFTARVPGNTGTYTDSAVAHVASVLIDSTYATTDNAPATSSVTVAATSILSKAFAPSTIGVGKPSTLTFTIANSPDLPPQSGLGFTDTLPAGLSLVGTPQAQQCGGTVSSSVNGSGAGVINFSGGTMAAGTASCTISATVTGTTDGLYTNSYDAGNLGNLAGGLNGTGAKASLQVSAPNVTMQFAPSTINSNQTSTLMFTISNGSGYPDQSGLGFGNTLPAGLVVLPGTPDLSPGCSWSYNVSANSTAFTLSSITMTAGTQSCMIMVPVGPTTNAVTTYTDLATSVSVSGNLVKKVTDQPLSVVSTPVLQKAFVPQVVGAGMPSVLTFTISNSSASTQSNISFSDLFPGGLVVANPPGVSFSSGCTSGSVYRYSSSNALVGGEPGIQVSNVAVAPNSSCTIKLNATSPTTGTYTNTWSSSGSSNLGSLTGLVYSDSAQTTLTVVGVKLTKAFGDPADPAGIRSVLITGRNTPLTFTITNEPTAKPAQSGIRFSDTLPLGLSLAGSPVTPQCGGTVSYSVNSSGAGVINFTGGSLALNADSCSIATTVTSTTQGIYTNSYPANFSNLPASGVDASNANAVLNVWNPPSLVLGRWASPASLQPGRVITYTVQVTNSGGPATSVTPSDTMSPYTTLLLNTYGPGMPFRFQDGSPSSNLALGTPQYSQDGVTWTTTPPANGSVAYWRIPMLNTMNGASASGNPSFTLTFQAVVK